MTIFRFRTPSTIAPITGSGRVGIRVFWAVGTLLPLAFLSCFFLWPVVALTAVGFGGDVSAATAGLLEPAEAARDWGWGSRAVEGVLTVFAQARTWRVIAQTLAQALCGTALSLALGLPAAFVLYRLDVVGRTLARAITTIPFVLPTVVVAVAFTALLGPGAPFAGLGLDQSFTAIILALAFFNVAVVARTVGGVWAGLDDRAEQAARVLGAAPVRVLVTVTLPRLAPAIVSAAALVFLFCSTSFGVVLLLGGRAFSTIETEIYRLTVQYLDLRSAAVLSMTQIVVVAAALSLSNRLRRFRERATEIRANTSERSRMLRPGRIHIPVLACFAVTALLLHITPMFTLLLRSLRIVDGNDATAGYGGFTLINYVRLVVPPSDTQLNGTVFEALARSFSFALLASALAMLLGITAALVASRRPRSRMLRRGIEIFDGIAMLPLGVSAVTVGFGLLVTMYRPFGLGVDLRSSVWLIPVAQALIALPLVLRTLLPVLRSLDSRQREAATMLGAAPLRVIATIDFGVLARPLGLALGFAFAASLGEFGASAFLVRPGADTLPVMIAQLLGRQGAEHYGMAVAASVVLAAITTIVMLVAERWRGAEVAEL